LKVITENYKIQNLLSDFKVPIKKVAIELNQEILDKKKLNKIKLSNNDKIEIVHFIGGG
jgi:thiamine biosynthesis protein ThiS